MAVCVGCGLKVDTGLLVVDRNPDTTDSGLECTPGSGLSLNVIHTSPSTIGLAGVGTASNPLNAAVLKSPDACNGLDVTRGNGLWAACPDAVIGGQEVAGTFGTATPFGINTGGAATFDLDSQCTATATTTCFVGLGGHPLFRLCNPICTTTEGAWRVLCGGAVIDSTSADFHAYAFMSITFDGAAYFSSVMTKQTIYSNGASRTFDIGNMEIVVPLSQVPLSCDTIGGRLTIIVLAGTASWDIAPTFGFHWGQYPTGYCA